MRIKFNSNVFRSLMALCLFLSLNEGYGSDNKAGKPVDNSPAMNFAGEWKTRGSASPKISILFHDRGQQVFINSKLIEMTGGRLPKPAYPAFFHYQNINYKGVYGGESYKDIGLINGVINSQEVLSGFYSEIDHDSDGEIIRGNSMPITLYPVKNHNQQQ